MFGSTWSLNYGDIKGSVFELLTFGSLKLSASRGVWRKFSGHTRVGGICVAGRTLNFIIIRSIIMRFYSNSTETKNAEPTVPVTIRASPPSVAEQITHEGQQPFDLFRFSQYCQNLIQVTAALNIELLRNNQLIEMSLALNDPNSPASTTSNEGSLKESEDNSTASRKNGSEINLEGLGQKPQEDIVSRAQSRKRRKVFASSSDQYQPEEDDDDFCHEEPGCSRISESKNIPKNYSKAIINFIKKNDAFTGKVLDHLGLDHTSFYQALNKLGGHVSSIAQLQWFWSDKDNIFGKAYRILSMQYLRKHCLPYLFNSRVNIFYKHIKYRHKMIEGVKHPESFTRMKEF